MFCEACERLLAVKDLVASGDRWRGRGVIASSNVSYAVERYSLVPIDRWPRSCICADLIRTVSSESDLLFSSLVGVVGLSAMVFQLTFSVVVSLVQINAARLCGENGSFYVGLWC